MQPTGLIILDGPDACGKTTLAKKFCELYDGVHLHCRGIRFDDMFNYQTEVLINATNQCDKRLVIIDRFWPSETCYANVFRGGTKFPHNQRLMDRIVRKHAGLYIFCLAEGFLQRNYFSAINRHRRNLDISHPYSDSDMRRVHDQYTDLWLQMHIRADVFKYHVETHGEDIKAFCAELLAVILMHRACQYEPCLANYVPNVVGHVAQSKYLLVGEKLKPKGELLQWPFYEHANSSAYLCKCLDEAKVDDTKLMLVNALDDFSELHIRRLVNEHHLVPVALGKIAYNVLKEMGISNVIALPHPAYVSRFESKNNDYVNLLRETLK